MADFGIIDSVSELEALAESLLDEPVVAVDTEADSFYHYFDKTCLVQIATKKNAWLVDPLALAVRKSWPRSARSSLHPTCVSSSTRPSTTSSC